VLTAGTNSYYSIDGMDMNSDSNSVTGFQPGTTLTLNATSTQPVTVGLTLDVGTIEQNVESVLTAYNSLLTYVNSATQVATTSTSSDSSSTTSTQGGPLPGDMTAKGIVSSIDSLFENEGGALGGNMNSLAEIGIQTDPNTGQLSLDEGTFQSAIQSNPTAVENLFTQVCTSSNPNVTFGQSTSATQSGNYLLREDGGGQVQISLAGSNRWSTGTREGDVVTFSDGPASGLSISAPAGTIGDDPTNPTTLTFSNGLAADLTNTIANMTDPNTGLIQLQTSTFQTKIDNENDQITTLTDQCNQYRSQLTLEFSTMEELVNNLKSQSASITSSFGTTTTTS
jgi:flagellar hook-associated protein 2